MNLSQQLEQHLTEEQFYNLLERNPSIDAFTPKEIVLNGHLLTCSRCASEFAFLQTSITGLRDSIHQSVAHVPTLCPTPNAPPARSRIGWAASLATAALLFGIAVPLVRTPDQAAPLTATTASTQLPDSDEALFEAVNRDLSTSIPPSLEPLALRAATDETSAPAAH